MLRLKQRRFPLTALIPACEMPRIRKCFVHGTTVAITFRTEEGLPLVASAYMRVILESILARAQSLYSVTICHFIVMPNHIHMLIVIEAPEVVPDFVAYVKRESAHAINRLLGREKHTVWCEGYDSATVLDAQKAIDTIVYIYTNPQRAHLVEKIETYPNLSSWEPFLQGGGKISRLKIMRDSIPVLPTRTLSLNEQQHLAQELEAKGTVEYRLVIEPDTWMSSFTELSNSSVRDINAEIVRRVREEEETLKQHRTQPVQGAHALRLADIRKGYVPRKRARRMICLASSKELRKTYLSWYRELCCQANEVLKRWKVGDWLAKLPPGFFIPGKFLRLNVTPALAPV